MSKRTWDGIKQILKLKSKDKTAPNSLTVNGNVIANKNCIAEIFNVYFVNIGSNLASKIQKGKKPFKGALQGLRQFLASESSLKAHLKSSFRSHDI